MHKLRTLLLVVVLLAPPALASSPHDGAGPKALLAANFLPNLSEMVKPAVAVRSLRNLHVDLKIDLPTNHTVNKEAPGRVAIRSPLVGDTLIAESPLDESVVALPLHWGEPVPTVQEGELVIEAVVYYCEESKKSVCKIRSLRIFQPVRVDPVGGGERLAIQAPVHDG
ncbi:MAG: hypothetical protein RL417_213 [Pseudomonadota bacterium]|jgi:hypothetical protein